MKQNYSPAADKILHYLMSHPYDKISLLTRNVPPQVKATVQAMYSRNDLPMRDTLLKTMIMVELGLKTDSEFNNLPQDKKEEIFEKYAQTLPENNPPLYNLFDDKAGNFLKEWAIKHGHNSIKEGAFISYVVEGVSIITAKALENDPLFHGQELSTRYKSFAKQQIPIPTTLANSPLKQELADYFKWSLENYMFATKKLNEFQEKEFQKPDDLTPEGWKKVFKAETFDNARYYLNAGITTSLGIVEDARTLERKLRNMLVFPLPEVKEVALEIIEKAKTDLPTLINHTEPNKYQEETSRILDEQLKILMSNEKNEAIANNGVRLIYTTDFLEDRLIADLLYGEGTHGYNYKQIFQKVNAIGLNEKKKILEKSLEKLGKHDEPLHAFRRTRMAFELYPDFGAWRDIHRQRRCNQTFPIPTCDFGYNIPWLLPLAGLDQHYKNHQEKTQEMFEKAKKICPEEAMIVPTLGFKVKQIFDADIEEWIYVWKLRTTEYGHFSYRQIFQETFKQAKPYITLLSEIIEKKNLINMNKVHHGRAIEEKRLQQKNRT